jgi:hypothetical protein
MAMENHQDRNDETLEEQQQDDDDASSSDSWGASLFVTKQQQEAKPELPSEGLQWKDNAIQDCFQLALSTHDDDNKGKWSSCSWSVPPLGNAQDNQFLSSWRPGSLSLPLWAVDPLVQSSQ